MEKMTKKIEKSTKIAIFRLIYSYFSTLWVLVSLWLRISISSIHWRAFWMVFCILRAFYRRSAIEKWGRMSKIQLIEPNNGSKTRALSIFFCITSRIHSWIIMMHNLLRLTPEKIMTTASKLRSRWQFLSPKQ